LKFLQIKKPKVSVVIPCYNHGQYLHDAVESLLVQTYNDFEIIIVNDGSDDSLTNQVVNALGKGEIRVINTPHQGLPTARNTGIKAARGEFILPLDADDEIAPAYIEKAVEAISGDPRIGIVYCEAALFGEQTSRWKLPEYSFSMMLTQNVVFSSALFRKKMWRKVGGYDPRMEYGLEDWDFWLKIIEMGLSVYRIPEVLFYYRVKKGSMADALNEQKTKLFKMYTQIFTNHNNLYLQHLPELFLAMENSLQKCRISSFSSLYIDSGKGFNDRDLIQRVIVINDRSEFKVTFDLAAYENIQLLRFDPFEGRYGKAILTSISCMGKGNINQIIPVQDISSNGSLQEDGFVMFQTQDPMFFIPVKTAVIQIEISGKIEIN
jgi:glycosyltransferase involved in cell wall biosynthesis